MKRYHLIEIEDQAWLPFPLRDSLTDFLTFSAGLSRKPFVHIAEKLTRTLRTTKSDALIDLGSGGGQPATTLAELVREKGIHNLSLYLTDLHPNTACLNRSASKCKAPVTVVDSSVDATNVPHHLRGFRMMNNSFHHLQPPLALKVLQDAVDQREGIMIFELFDRSPAVVGNLIGGLIVLFFTAPFMPPFRLSRIIFTYMIPVIPLLIIWDGLVSGLRVYSQEELRNLVSKVENHESFAWDIGKISVPFHPTNATYLIGYPNQKDP